MPRDRRAAAAIILCAVIGASMAEEPSGSPQRLSDSRLRTSDSSLRIAFTEDTGVIRNPGQGWTASTWSFGRADPLVNIGALYARFAWGDLEPEDGVYDWTKLDALLDMASSQGIPASFRIMCVSAPHSRTGWTSPKWVFDKGAKDEPFVTPVDIGGRKVEVVQHAPVFDDPVFMEEHRRFLEALAARYDGDPRLAGLDIGSYGNWGEWHCFGLPPNTNQYFEATAKLPFVPPKVYPAEIRRQYADWYLEYFRKAPLVFMTDDWETFRHALGDGKVLRVGMRRDGVGSPHHFDHWIGTSPYDAVPRMADVWRDRPVWFEFFCPVGDFKTKGWSVERSVEWMLTNHVTVVNTTPFSPWDIGDNPEMFALLRKIDLYAGARLVPRDAEVRRMGRRTVAVRLVGENIGVARIHLPYVLQIVVAGSDGHERFVHDASADPGTWLPGPFAVEERFTVPAETDRSGARLSLRLRHRGGVFRDFRFAALETADDGSLPLGTIPASEEAAKAPPM